MATDKIQCGLRVKESIYRKAKVLAAQEQRSFNNLIEYAIQKYIDEYEAQNGQIQIPYLPAEKSLPL